jgi:spore coat polysaccharide biosynthesis predicted glycosyltransferase SpsG
MELNNSIDIIFYCKVTNASGFGHGARCSKIANIILGYNKNLKIGIKGEFSNNSKKLMKNECSNLEFYTNNNFIQSKIGFIDMIFDTENPDIFDDKFISEVEKNSKKTIFLSSGTILPKIKNNNIYIGYQPTTTKFNKNNIYWGFKFAPTCKIENFNEVKREDNSIFIALGGFKNNIELEILIDAINAIKEVKTLNILNSPVNDKIYLDKNKYRDDLKIKIHQNVETIIPFLCKSSIVIASYGNLCFEALAYNAPLCIVAQKPFQNSYAKLLESKKLSVSIGIPSIRGVNKIRDSIKLFYINRDLYSSKSNELPSNGLKEIATTIINNL